MVLRSACLIALIMASLSVHVWAETVALKSGQVLEGKIVEKTNESIKLDPGVGMVMTYYLDEVDTIDGQKVQASAPVNAPGPAPEPQTQPQDQPQVQIQPQDQPQVQTQPTDQGQNLPTAADTSPGAPAPVTSDNDNAQQAQSYYTQAVSQYNAGDYVNALYSANAAMRMGYGNDISTLRNKIQEAISAQETQRNLNRPTNYTYSSNSYSSYHSSNSGKDIGYAIFGFFFGIWAFFRGFKKLREKRMVENIPASTVRGLSMGLVELNGKAKSPKTFPSPLSGTDCLFYRYTVERYESSGKSGHWVTISQGDSSDCPFCLEDGTGQIIVLPKMAEFVMPVDYKFTTGLGSGLPENLVSFMDQNGLQYKTMFGNNTLRFNEWYLKPEEPVFVLGTAQKGEDKLSEPGVEGWRRHLAEDWQGTDVIIAKGEPSDIYIVSDESQTQIVKDFSWQAFAGIWGGAALSLVLLAYLLFRFNLWSKF